MSNFLIRESCPACGSTSSKTLLRKKFTESPLSDYLETFYRGQGTIDMSLLESGDYVLNACNACGLVYQKEIPNDDLMYVLYEKWIDPEIARKLHESYSTSYYMKQLSELGNIILTLGDKPKELKCLDFGMGWGLWCRMARGFGCNVYGVELSQSRIEYAESWGISVLTYADIEKQKFDFINTEQVFEHIPNPFETLSYLKGALSKSGIIKVSVPDGWKIKSKINSGRLPRPDHFRDSLIAVQPLEHINSFDHKSLVKMGEKAGLRVLEVPQHYSCSVLELIKSRVRPIYHSLRGSQSTRVYFTHT